ncbi:MAG TPA: hypothetical protein VIO94_15000, partial [Phenylobacterium sp.]
MMAEALEALVRANLAAGVAVLFVLALRSRVLARLGAGAAYRMWIVVPLVWGASLLPARTATLAALQPAAHVLDHGWVVALA